MNKILEEFNKKWQTCNWSEEIFISPRDAKKGYIVRFHSLAKSKRYPENDTEMQIALDRYNSILDELEFNELYVITSDWTNKINEEPLNKIRKELDPYSEEWKVIDEDPSEDDEEYKAYRHLLISKKTRSDQSINQILEAVARNDIAGVFFIPTDLSWIYHPYDGGLDLIFLNRTKRDNIKDKYKKWLPANSIGL